MDEFQQLTTLRDELKDAYKKAFRGDTTILHKMGYPGDWQIDWQKSELRLNAITSAIEESDPQDVAMYIIGGYR